MQNLPIVRYFTRLRVSGNAQVEQYFGYIMAVFMAAKVKDMGRVVRSIERKNFKGLYFKT